jgi:hypothetical protein
MRESWQGEAMDAHGQGCQMAYLHTYQKSKLGEILEGLGILIFGTFCDHLVSLNVIWSKDF